MRALLVITLLTPLLWAGRGAASKAGQGEPAAGPNLSVVEFSWRRWRREESGSGGAPPSLPRLGDATSGGGTAPPARDIRQVREAPDEQQARALHRVEGNPTPSEAGAARSSRPYKYKYEITVRNTDARAVAAFYWAAETPQTPQPGQSSSRQFFCATNVNPGESREFKAESLERLTKAVGPSRMKGATGQVVINRVEYADGSVWQRPGWEGVGGVVPTTGETTRTRVQGCVAIWTARRR